jgi:hypothetical protein
MTNANLQLWQKYHPFELQDRGLVPLIRLSFVPDSSVPNGIVYSGEENRVFLRDGEGLLTFVGLYEPKEKDDSPQSSLKNFKPEARKEAINPLTRRALSSFRDFCA